MLHSHVFDKISTEFRGIFRVFVNFAAPRPREISEAQYRVVKLNWLNKVGRLLSVCTMVCKGNVFN